MMPSTSGITTSTLTREDGKYHYYRAQKILKCAAQLFIVSEDDITGQSRRRDLLDYRQATMYVVRSLTLLSYPAMGRLFGHRDHTTIISAVERGHWHLGLGELIEELLEEIEVTGCLD